MAIASHGVYMVRLSSKWASFLLLWAGTLTSFCLAGCSHKTALIYTKSNATAPDVAGIPFFVKQGVCAKESVWLEPQYTITFSIFVDDDPPITNVVTLDREGYLAPETQGTIAELQRLPKTAITLSGANSYLCPAVVGHSWEAAEQVAVHHRPVPNLDLCVLAARCGLEDPSQNLFLVANTAVVKPEVDYSRPYYINARSPWIGTGSLDAKLATDGTLTEVNAQTDDETWSTIINGISSIASGYFGGAATSAAAAATSAATTPAANSLRAGAPVCSAIYQSNAGGPPRWPVPQGNKVKYDWSVKTVIYKHDHTQEYFTIHDPGQCTAEPHGVTGGNFTVTMVEPGGKPDKDAISVSGTVTLPKKDADK